MANSGEEQEFIDIGDGESDEDVTEDAGETEDVNAGPSTDKRDVFEKQRERFLFLEEKYFKLKNAKPKK